MESSDLFCSFVARITDSPDNVSLKYENIGDLQIDSKRFNCLEVARKSA